MNNVKIYIIFSWIALMAIGQAGVAHGPIIDMSMNSNPIIDMGISTNLYNRRDVDYDAENDYEFDENYYVLKDLNRAGRNVNYQDKDGSSLLMMISAKNDQKKIMKFILEQLLVNPNLKDRRGQTALHFAALGGNLSVVQLLLQHNADINVQDYEGKTPLYIAVERNYVGIANFLLQQGAQRNLGIFENGALPLDRAHTPAMRQVFKDNPVLKRLM